METIAYQRADQKHLRCFLCPIAKVVQGASVDANDERELEPASIGVGLGGMRQRAKELGGELRPNNANPGTLVEVVLPVTASTE